MPIAAITVTDSWAEIGAGDTATRIDYASPGVGLTPPTAGALQDVLQAMETRRKGRDLPEVVVRQGRRHRLRLHDHASGHARRLRGRLMVALQRVIGFYVRFDDATAAIATVLREKWAINVDRKGLVGGPGRRGYEKGYL